MIRVKKATQVKHLTDDMALQAVDECQRTHQPAPDILARSAHVPRKVAWRKLEQLQDRGIIDCGTSLNFPFRSPSRNQT